MIQHIFLDFFGVLASEVAPFWLREHMSVEEAIAYKATVVERVDEGKITYRELLGYLEQKTGVPADQIHEEWYALSHPHTDFIAYLRTLKGKYDLCLLSNASSEFLRILLDKHGLHDLLDHVFISAEIKLTKPNREIFEYALGTLGFKAEECVFVDDNLINCEGARKAGLHAVHYESAAQVQREFEALGIRI